MAAEKNQVQVIARAAAILRALENERAGLSLGQIAARVDLARSTVQRIVGALAAENLVIAGSATEGIRLGSALLRLAASVETDVATLARPYLMRLSATLRETVDLATVRRGRLVFIDQIVGPQRLRAVSAVGEVFPLHCTANGKAYLAQLSDAEIERSIGRDFPPLTPRTLTRLEPLMAELRAVRRSGVAFDREEHTLGISAAGVAFQDSTGGTLAISAPVPTARFVAQEAEITRHLLETRQALAERFAGTG